MGQVVQYTGFKRKVDSSRRSVPSLDSDKLTFEEQQHEVSHALTERLGVVESLANQMGHWGKIAPTAERTTTHHGRNTK